MEAGVERGLTPLVGRQKELALLRERLAEARTGRGQIVLLAGEPGVGKSRLLLEFQQSAGAGDVSWLAGRSVSFGDQMAYLLIIDLLKGLFRIEERDNSTAISARIEAEVTALGDELRSAVPLLKHLLSIATGSDEVLAADAQERRVKTFEAIRNLVLKKAQRRPLVILIEDLHWVDRTSEDLLVSLADSLAMAPVMMLLSYRPEYRNPFPERSFISRLTLQHLTDEESLEMASRVLSVTHLPEELRKLVTAKTEGNPFFVEEMLKSLLETGALQPRQGTDQALKTGSQIEVPDTIQDLIMGRINRLEEAPRRILQLAAVIGREFAVSLLAGLADVKEPLVESLQKLKTLELIYDRSLFPEHTCFFKHALTQEVAYESLLQERRKELHRLVAGAVEKLYSSQLPQFYGVLAYHYEQGEEWERAFDYLRRAAEQSRGVGAHREEASQLSRAMAIAQRLERPAVVTELQGQRGTARVKAGMWEEARPDLETALQELPSENLGRRAELLSSLAAACFWGLDLPQMRKCAEEGHALAEQAGRNDLVADLLAWLGASRQAQGDLASATDFFERALAKGGGYCSAVLGTYALTSYFSGRLTEAVQRAQESAEAFRSVGDTFAATFAHPHLGLALAASGRYSEATRVFEEARQLGVKHELWTFHARAIALSAGFHLDVFDFKGNELLAEEARERAGSVGFHPSQVSANLDLVFNYSRRGEISQAERLVKETAALAIQVGGWHAWLWEIRLKQAHAELACARGDWPDALRWASETVSQSRAVGRTKYVTAGLETRGKALVALGRTREAIADLRSALQLARKMGDPAMSLRVANTLLATEGDDELLAEARMLAAKIIAELPTEEMRDRFRLACEGFQLGSFEPGPKPLALNPTVSSGADDLYGATNWSVVLQSGERESTPARAALTKLCETYWYPLYVFIRRQGQKPEDTRDLVQGFFALVQQRDYFQDVERARGKFRSFLLIALKRFMANTWDRTKRPAPAEGVESLSINEEDTETRYLAEEVDNLPPEKAYERQWAMTLLQQVLDRLEAEFFAVGSNRTFRELKIFLSGEKSPTVYTEIGQKLGMGEGAIKLEVQRLRRRYRELLRTEISSTVTSPDGIDDEFRQLFAALA